MAEINEREYRQPTEKISEIQSRFVGKINKTNKP